MVENNLVEIDCLVEINLNSNLKYEYDYDNNKLRLDRILDHYYPTNYGCILNTLGSDGDALDVLILTPYSIIPNTLIKCKAIGVLELLDEGVRDDKIIAYPIDEVDKSFSNFNDICDVENINKEEILNFFSNYKIKNNINLIEIIGFSNKMQAKQTIENSINNYNKAN